MRDSEQSFTRRQWRRWRPSPLPTSQGSAQCSTSVRYGRKWGGESHLSCPFLVEARKVKAHLAHVADFLPLEPVEVGLDRCRCEA